MDRKNHYGRKIGERLYQCPECGLRYKKKKFADQCGAWCKEYKSCNLEIIGHAVQGGRKN